MYTEAQRAAQQRYQEKHKDEIRARRQTPGARAKARARASEYRQRPDVRAKLPEIWRRSNAKRKPRAITPELREKQRAARQRYTERHPDAAREALARYRQSEKGKAALRARQQTPAYKEQMRLAKEHYNARHPDRIREAERRYRQSAIGKAKALARERTPEVRAYRKAYRACFLSNTGAFAIQNHIGVALSPLLRSQTAEWQGNRATTAYKVSPKGQEQYRRYRSRPDVRERERLRQHTEVGRINRARAKHRRRARELGVQTPADLTRAQWDAIKAAYGGRCAYCHRKVKRLEKDHIIPIAKGGALTAANVVPACRQCNARKSTRLIPVQPVLVAD